MPAIQRVAEIFEALFNLERDLTGELLSELACCTAAELEQLFGNPLSRRASPAPAIKPPEPVEQTATGVAPVEKPRDPHANWRWDHTPKRIAPKLPSAFDYTRQLTQPRRGSHWSD
jgi:hypothetical protein